MNSPTAHPTRPLSKKWQHVLLHLFAIVIALTAFMPSAKLAHADTVVCSLNDGCPVYPPPDLLNLNQSLYNATPAQVDALQYLEDQAVANTIADHALATTDGNAVKSWGRDDAEAELFALLVQAIKTPAASRTAAQQAAVDWVSTVEQRQAEQAAQDAGLEYVKWAGLDQSSYYSLIYADASQSTLQTFLSGPVLTYNNTNTSLADGGYCVYRSPTPYASEYTGHTDATCYAPCPSILGCKPPTPSYDQFVKWGEADATYAFLNSKQYVYAASSIALDAGGLFGALAGAAAAGAITSRALATSQVLVESAFQNAVYPYLQRKLVQALTSRIVSASVEAVTETVSATIASTVGFIVGIVIDAVVTAVLEGIDVGNAAALPEKLATLIVNARTTAPIPASLLADSNGASNLYSLFVGATLPSPMNQTCDNTNQSTQPGLTVISGKITVLKAIPCLNPTPIPPATNTDSTFVVTAKGATTQTSASMITWVDTASQTTTTARLSGNWFIVQANGSTSWVQTLRIPYTDWDGKEQIAWLLGNPTDGYHFVSFVVSDGTALDSSTCIANGTCSYSTSIKYVGSDGNDYSASVRGYRPSTGTPTYSSAVEASPVTFNANGYAPEGATLPLTYQWRFQRAGCGISCQHFDPTTMTNGPDYTDPVSGATASYTWQTGGNYYVELKATDAIGAQATNTFQISVSGVPPTLKISPDCSVNPGVLCNKWTGDAGSVMALSGTLGHTGSLDNEYVTVNWGDESDADIAGAGPNILSLFGNPLTLTPSSDGKHYTLADSHTYAKLGIYYGTVSVADTSGGTASQTFKMTIRGTQTITFLAIGGHSYGDVFSISATGGASGQPVTFSSTPGCALSNVSGGAGTGSATVTVLGAGACDITANQAGTTVYNPAPSVTQRIFLLLARLTVTASSASITYGETPPAITPAYSGFKNGDTATMLSTPATCTIASNSGAAGSYATTCSGASAPNYSTNYVPGTLTINPAPLSITAKNTAMTYGGPVPSFDAQYSGLLNGDTSAVVSGLTCVAKDVGGSTPAGNYPITCGGGSAANYSLSYVAGTLTINKAGTSTALSLSPSPSVYGQSVTFTAAVSVNSPGSGHPGGAVAFKDGGSDIAGCAAQPVDTASGTAICTTAALGVAQHGVTATYSGDPNFVGSSTASALTQTVNKAAVTTTIGASANPSTAGQSVTFSVTVAAAAPGAGVPTGSVTFKDGATTLGTGTLSASNGATVASFTTSGLGASQHTITASYSGDGNFLATGGATLTQYVNTNLSSYPKLPSGAYNLSNTNLTGGYFVNAPLAGASLSGSNLTGAIFLGANLAGGNLTSANLKLANFAGANLAGANLSNSILTEANLTGANLTGANLTGVNLKGATGLKTATLTNIIWNKTTCPDGTISSNNRGTCIGHL